MRSTLLVIVLVIVGASLAACGGSSTSSGSDDPCELLTLEAVGSIIEGPSEGVVADSRSALGNKICRWAGSQDERGREASVIIAPVSDEYFSVRSMEDNARPFDGLGDGAYTYASSSNSGQQILSIGFRKGEKYFELTGTDFPEVSQEGMITAARAAVAAA